MRMWKRILAVVIALCMLVGPGGYLAETEEVYGADKVSGDYRYNGWADGTIEITKYTGSDVTLEIPGELDGKKVVGIGYNAFSKCEGLKEVSIPSGVEKIGQSAFSDCTGLEEINIPSGVTTIGNSAFSGCTRLLKINIPSGVTSIGQHAFSGCIGLVGINIPSGVTCIGRYAFSDCIGLEEINIPGGVTTIGDNVFRGCTGLMEINISSGVTIIADRAFSDCTGLLKIDIPSGVTSIGRYAFFNCTGLEGINIPSGVTSIGDFAFCGCTRLEGINIPSGVTSIGSGAFGDCTGLLKIDIPSGVTSIGSGAFSDCIGLLKIDIPSGVTSIGSSAFDGCTRLEGIRIPSGVTTIEDNTFSDCTGLLKIDIPSGVTTIGWNAFYGCKGLEGINIPSGVTTIGHHAFSNCTGLKEISIPDEVKDIGLAAFGNCESLNTVYYSGTEEQWKNLVNEAVGGVGGLGNGNEALLKASIHFNSNPTDLERNYKWNTLANETIEITKYIGSDTTVNIPKEIDGKPVTRIGDEAFRLCKDLVKVSIPSGVVSIGEDAFWRCSGLTEINIPDSITDIGRAAFADCANLTAITIPNGITKIEEFTFSDCTKLKEVIISDSVTSIGKAAFQLCTNLTKVNMPAQLTNIGEMAFNGCKNLIEMTIPNGVVSIEHGTFFACTGLKKINMPNSITNIGSAAFVNCVGLNRIDIPDSVTSIEGSAFEYCSNIKDVYYPNTEEKWNKIEIDADGNEPLLNATKHFKEEIPDPVPEEVILPTTVNTKQELEKLKDGDALSLEKDFQQFLSAEQIDIIESCIYTWLAEINYAYQYAGDSDVKSRIMKSAGIDSAGDFTSGSEQAVTHISVWTKYGPKTLEITLGLGKPDGNGSLYLAYGKMHYQILEKGSLPIDMPTSGQIGKDSYTDMETFINSVAKSAEDFLHSIFHWQKLDSWQTANILTDKTVSEIIGNKNGCFVNGIYIVYAKPLSVYSKKVTIACPVDVHVYSMDGTEAGSIVNNEPKGGNQNVQLAVDGDTKIVYLAGDDYYLNLCGTDTGTMKYEVEEIANEEVQRDVQFLELQLKKDMQYEGYVFRPLNIDSDLYALRTVGGASQEVFYADKDKQHQALSLFKRVEGLTLGQGNTTVDTGRTLQMSASVSPLDASNPDLQWSTNDESVAKVDSNGMVTAVGAGRTTVTVSTKDGSFLKQFCIIDVADKTHEEAGANPGGNPGTTPGGSTSTTPGGSLGTTPGASAGTNPSGSPGTNPGSSTGTNLGSSTGTAPGGNISVTPGSDNSSNTNPDNVIKPPLEQEPSIVSLSYVLQFNANGGTGLSRATMTLLSGDSPGIMPKAKRKGYTFNGWYTQQKGGTRISGDKPLEQAVTLYAQWTKVTAPSKAKAPALKSKKKGQIKVSLKKVAGAAGYQIAYSTSKQFTSAKTKTVRTSANVKTLTGLKPGRKYYVRVRAYKVDSVNSRIYGTYSMVKSVKAKN